jgi:hypothetical protein
MKNAKPCPFCGKKMLGMTILSDGDGLIRARVDCRHCPMSGPERVAHTQRGAMMLAKTAWNRRAQEKLP